VATAARNRSVDFTDSGLATQDVELGWQLQCEVAREVAAKGIAPDALVLTHQRGTFAPADGAGRPLGPHIVWMDRRGLPIVAELVKRFGDGFYDRFLLPAMPYTGLSKMLWLERNRAGAPLYLPAHAIHAVRMTGAAPVCDPSTASFMGPWDIRNSRWDTEFCGLVGLPPEKLPVMAPSTTIVGELSHAAAIELGLRPGIAVVLGAADGQAAAVGCGCTEPGVMMINVGTATGVQSFLAEPRPHPDRALVTGAHALPGAYEMEGHTQAAAAAFDWLARIVGVASPTDMIDLAKAAPLGADGVIAVPTMNGLSAPISRPEAAGSFSGLRLRHGREHLVRALLEGLCLEIRWLSESLRKAVGTPRCVALAGGLTQDGWFAGVLASVLGLPVTRVTTDPAMSGIAMLAAIALGRPTVGFVGYGETIASDEADHARYSAIFDDFVALATSGGTN
jgi:sugar (pentulose or hexulose) kinase